MKNIYDCIDFDAALFDMDGLVFDTEKVYHRAWIHCCKKYGYDITEEIIAGAMGLNYAASVKYFKSIFGDDFPFDALRADRIEYIDRYFAENPPEIKLGFKELIDYLKKNGKKTALATSTEQTRAFSYLKAAGITDAFDVTVYGNEVKNGKPQPDIFLKAAERLGTDIKKCLIFEDSFNGIRAAFASGGIPIMVPDTVIPDNEIRNKCFRIQSTLWSL